MFHELFRKFAAAIAKLAGTVWAFIIALTLVFTWLVSGPLFNFSSTWQLFINTLTTVVTFLMVFLIQNTQNRDNKALHLKLDELLRSIKGAKLNLVNIDEYSDQELDKMQEEFRELQEKYRKRDKQSPLS